MATAKPQISILMAVYEPRMDWLKEQLDSLNAQTYPNLRLYVRDDCSPTVPYEEVCALVGKSITAFPFSIARNEENLGSNKTFERLTAEAGGEYFAYCDQDDVWLPEKLVVLQEALEQEQAELVCSDMYIINGEGKTVTDSITKIRRHHVFRSGEGLAPGLLISNFASGCTVLMRAETARTAMPFCPYMVHDHYLTLFAAVCGRVVSCPRPLIRYRVHGGNQTGLMAGVHNRGDYLELRIRLLRKRLEWLRENLPGRDGTLEGEINRRLEWIVAREERMSTGCGGVRTIWKGRSFGPRTTMFELVAPLLSERAFKYAANLARHNRL